MRPVQAPHSPRRHAPKALTRVDFFADAGKNPRRSTQRSENAATRTNLSVARPLLLSYSVAVSNLAVECNHGPFTIRPVPNRLLRQFAWGSTLRGGHRFASWRAPDTARRQRPA